MQSSIVHSSDFSVVPSRATQLPFSSSHLAHICVQVNQGIEDVRKEVGPAAQQLADQTDAQAQDLAKQVRRDSLLLPRCRHHFCIVGTKPLCSGLAVLPGKFLPRRWPVVSALEGAEVIAEPRISRSATLVCMHRSRSRRCRR